MPALINNLSGCFVTAVNLANDDRTRATSADLCPDSALGNDVDITIVNAKCPQGSVFKAGYNAFLTQNSVDNSLTLGAASLVRRRPSSRLRSRSRAACCSPAGHLAVDQRPG